MFRSLVVISCVGLLVAPMNAETPRLDVIGEVVRLDPAVDALVPKDAKIEMLAEGFEWSEGPVWVNEMGGFLLFSDVPKNVVHQWSETGGLRAWLKPSGYTGRESRGGETGSNGLTLDAAGRLILCQHGDRRVARLDAPWSKPESRFVTIADQFDGKRFNSPNDLVFHSSGALYFTDPPYGMVGKFEDPKRETDYLGVYRVGTDGNVALLTDQRTAPNGIAFSPDEQTLYVAQSDPQAPHIYAYDVQSDGSVQNERVFFDATQLLKTSRGLPDGLKLDQAGNLFATGPGGVLVISPAGEHLGTISTGQLVANCAFGDDGKTLYMTSDMCLARIRLSTTGVGF
ncbi:MAG: SMP-30/gluconolactonase/LRE family protein [Planctomycetota bacterium]